MQPNDQAMVPSSLPYVLGWLAAGAVAGGVLGAAVHPGPQYVEPVGNQIARTAAFGAIAAAVTLGLLALGVRMGAIPTA